MKRVLLTAFEPFDGEAINPSLETARCVAAESLSSGSVTVAELPVERLAAIELGLKRLRESRPDILIMLGEAGGRYRITPERIAINVDDFRIPDNAGNQPHDQPIVRGGPPAYFSTLPIRAITDRLVSAEIPAAISNTAGTFLCNRLFYSVMHAISTEGMATVAGFIHLPYLHQQAIPKRIDQPSLSLESMVKGIRLAVEVSLTECRASKQS